MLKVSRLGSVLAMVAAVAAISASAASPGYVNTGYCFDPDDAAKGLTGYFAIPRDRRSATRM